MRKIVVDGRDTFETALDVEVGDEVILPDSGTGRWIGTVTALTSDYRGACRRVTGLARRRAEVEEREVARQAVRIDGWRPGELLVESDPPSSVSFGSAAAWRDFAGGID